MLMPKKTKFRKFQKGRMRGVSKGARTIHFGTFGIKALEPARMTSRQIEAMRLALSKKLKKVGKFFIRVFPDKSISKKPAETRMGKGKGSPVDWVAVVKRERIIAEVAGVDKLAAKEIFKSVSYKLPLKVAFVESSALENVQPVNTDGVIANG